MNSDPSSTDRPCARKYVRGESNPAYMVCVCNATYCDDVASIDNDTTFNNDPMAAAIYVSSESGQRLQRSNAQWTNSSSLKCNSTIMYHYLFVCS